MVLLLAIAPSFSLMVLFVTVAPKPK